MLNLQFHSPKFASNKLSNVYFLRSDDSITPQEAEKLGYETERGYDRLTRENLSRDSKQSKESKELDERKGSGSDLSQLVYNSEEECDRLNNTEIVEGKPVDMFEAQREQIALHVDEGMKSLQRSLSIKDMLLPPILTALGFVVIVLEKSAKLQFKVPFFFNI